MIEEILPPQVVAEETYGDEPAGAAEPVSALYPEEARLVARAVPRRQGEFTTVRVCARRALARLGLPPSPIVSSRRGAPQWPESVVGSMTHCDGYRAAVLARDAEVASVGVDAEPDGPLPEGVLDVVSTPKERVWIRALTSEEPGPYWERLLFCAKESVFKTWYPLTERELDFTEAEVTVDAAAGTFSARLLVPGFSLAGRRVQTLSGRWVARHGLIVTAICLPAAVESGAGTPADTDVAAEPAAGGA